MDKIIKLDISECSDGKTIKEILFNDIKLSASAIRSVKQIKNGITLNGKHVYVTEKVKKNDILIVNLIDKNSPNIEPVDMELDILYEDEDIIAVNKPRGMPTHPSHNHHNDTLANGIAGYYKNSSFTFRAITRLDKDTSGIVLISKNVHSAKLFGEDMRHQRIKKEYYAIVNGGPYENSGIINKPIKRVADGIILRCVSPDGKEAITEFEVIKRGEKYSLLKLIPVTGRTHQLRVHTASLKMPIYGDDLYGAPQNDIPTHLHCGKLTFTHPFTEEEMILEADFPEDMKFMIENLK